MLTRSLSYRVVYYCKEELHIREQLIVMFKLLLKCITSESEVYCLSYLAVNLVIMKQVAYRVPNCRSKRDMVNHIDYKELWSDLYF